jgi:hypothetical protein
MSIIQQIGRHTGQIQKRAGVASAVGKGIDSVVRGGWNALRAGMKSKGVVGKGLTLGAAGTVGGALNEGMDRLDLPSIQWDADRTWTGNPAMQYQRLQNNPSMWGQVKEYFKRPMQSIFSAKGPLSLKDYVDTRGGLPPGLKLVPDPDNPGSFKYEGKGRPNMNSVYQGVQDRIAEGKRLAGELGGNGGTSGGGGSSDNNKYLFFADGPSATIDDTY